MPSLIEFPEQRIVGQYYRIEKPEIEFHGVVGKVEGSHLLLKGQDGSDRLAEPEEQLDVLQAIMKAFRMDIAKGKSDEIGMVIVSSVGGIALCQFGIVKPTDFTEKRVYEEEGIVVVHDIDLRDPKMHPWQNMKVCVSSELHANQVITARADGTPL